MDNRPVGVFDSGLGGLTAVKEFTRIMPGEDIVYFGDTGRVPYGTRARDTIIKYAGQDVRFLLEHEVKAILIACGTVSSTALEQARALSPVPVWGVIEPAAKAAAQSTKTGKIGVIATGATIRSGSFERAVKAFLPQARVISKACPMFVPLVENGYFKKGSRAAEIIAHEYLDGLSSKIDTLILGCTHYPLLREILLEVMGNGVTLINSGREAALCAKEKLREAGLENGSGRPGQCRFFVSDLDPDDAFARLAEIFLDRPAGTIEKVDIEKY